MKNINMKAQEAFQKAQKKFLFKEVELEKAIEMPEVTILLCKGKIGSLIGKNGVIVAELSKILENKVRIVEHSNKQKKIISDLIGNVRLLGVNEIYSPAGQETKIIINSQDKNSLITNPKHLEQALTQLLGTKTTIEFK